MKEYLFLYKEFNNRYYQNNNIHLITSLKFLSTFLSEDFRSWDNNFLTQEINLYNTNFIYYNFKNQMLYVGESEWEYSDGEMHCPDEEEFPHYVNESNSCRMHVQNFVEFKAQWIKIKQDLPPFALIYRDDHDWVHCKGFNTQEEMEFFVQHHQSESVH